MKKILYFIGFAFFLTQSVGASNPFEKFLFGPNNDDPRILGLTIVGTVAACCGIAGFIKSLKRVATGPQEPNPSLIKNIFHRAGNLFLVPMSAALSCAGVALILFNKELLTELNKLEFQKFIEDLQ